MDQNDQMEAVFKSSRTDEIDPVSGNEVPTGSLPEEVRDDIPAQLSEGEYVVPADVVRYYGVKHFEDMRTEAKQGFQQLDAGGRIGGDPVGMEMGDEELPFDISELQMTDDDQPEQPMMAKGGYVSGYAVGGQVSGGVTYVMYTNAEGATMQIPFFNGVPMSVIPEGFYVQGEAPVESVANVQQSSNSDDGGGSFPPPEAVDYENLTAEELSKMVEQQNSKTAKLVSTGIGLVNPLFGLLAKFAFSDMSRRTENEIKRRIESGEYTDSQGFYEGLLEETAEKKPGFLKSIFNEITGKDKEFTGELLKEDTDAAVRLALSDTPVSEDKQTVLAGLSNPEPSAMSDLESREWRTKLGYTPETTTPEVTETDVAKAGDLDIPEITTTELEPSDPYVAEVTKPVIEADPRFFDVATPGLDDTPRGSDSDYFPSSSSSSSSSSDSDSDSSLADETEEAARKSRANREKYSEAGLQYGGKLITDSDGSTRAVPTYKTEDVIKAGINPGGR